MKEWLGVYERYLLHIGAIKHNVDIFQLTGTASASAGTHRRGGAADLAQVSVAAVQASRNGGAMGWRRDADPHDGQPDFRPTHQHLVLKGCPHSLTTCSYQVGAGEAGYSGLGSNGRGTRDDGPRQGVKFPLRTYKEGIAWMKSQMDGAPEPVPTPPPTTVTLLDHAHWNVASVKAGWFPVPWSERGDKIGQQLAALSSSIVTCNETHTTEQTATIHKHLGDHYRHVSSPIGNDIFFDDTKYDQTRAYVEYSLKAQARYAGVLHLTRLDSGHPLTVVNTHFPYASASLRSTAARNLVALLADVDGPIILSGDFNNQSFSSGTPHYHLRRAGYDFLREQGPVVNGNLPEYPKKGQWLSDIATIPTRPGLRAKLLSGSLTLTSPKLSDHRPIKSRTEIK
jgi:hypothetical protein